MLGMAWRQTRIGELLRRESRLEYSARSPGRWFADERARKARVATGRTTLFSQVRHLLLILLGILLLVVSGMYQVDSSWWF